MLHVERDHLIAPRELPDGTVVWDEHAPSLAERVRNGDATYGWTGDDRLSLCMNTDYHDPADDYRGPAWEVWRRHEDGTSSLVMRKKGTRIDEGQLLRLLADHDSRYVDVAVQVELENAQREKHADGEFGEHVEDKADKLAWALGRDLGMAAQDGRYFPLGDMTTSAEAPAEAV